MTVFESSARAYRWLLVALLLVPTACAPSVGPLEIVEGTVSRFEPVLLAEDDLWTCAGILDLDRDATDEIVLVAPSRIRTLAADGSALHETTIEPPLNGPPLGCDAADLDGDGDLDLALADGDGGVVAYFTEDGWELAPLPTIDGMHGRAVTFALALFDGDGDGVQDAYLARSYAGSAASFVVDGCHDLEDGDFLCGAPDETYPGVPNVMLRGEGGGAFTVRPDTGAEDPWQSQAIGVLDVDGDGRQDLVVANDAMENRVYLSTGDLRFHDATVQLGLALRNHGMSVLAGDLDDDGRVDLAFSDIGPPLVMRRTENGFVRLGESAGFRRVAQWSWGGAMEDFDADGDLDLLFENQGIELGTLSLYCTADCTFGSVPREELLLYRNDSHARFSAERPAHGDASPFGGEDFAGGTALAHGDVDRDGVLDVVLTRKARQGGPTQAWLLPGSSSVGRGISVEAPQGALVQACTTERCSAREVLGGHGFAAIMARRIFFGIGSASEATVTVSWRGVEHDLGIVHAGELARFGD